ELVPLHGPDHILVHPERLEEYKDGTKDPQLYTLPNLPNPFCVTIRINGKESNPAQEQLLACERALLMDEARLTRRIVFRHSEHHRCIADSERWVSWHNRQILGWRYELQCDDPAASIEVIPSFNTTITNVRGIRLFNILEENNQPNSRSITVATTDQTQTIRMAMAWNRIRKDGKTIVEAVVAISLPAEDDPLSIARNALAKGYATLRDEHITTVAQTLRDHTLEIGSDPLTAEGLRHGQLHLEMAICHDNPNVSVPIKGLTGEGYRFMVFWDTDFHMFPYYLYTNPEQARNLLLYRYNLLDSARQNAQAWGYRGAQTPWETGTSGKEETAPWLNLQDRELHISADTAYGVMLYDRIADDPAFLEKYGAEIVFESARFYASRATWIEAKQRFEIRNIGCPDQYHTWADNNPFISRMARWNIAYAARIASDPRTADARKRIGLDDKEVAELQNVAQNLYIIPPDANGVIEEFDGYFTLDPDLRGITEKFCAHSMAVKQPDVVASFHLFPEDYPQEVCQNTWRFYAERTLHGSSLSLPGMALAAAVSNLIPESVPFFQKGSRLDLDDVNGNTSLGMHISAYAVLWEAAVFGYLGLDAQADGIRLRPRIPQGWAFIAAPIHWKGQHLRIRADHQGTTITADANNTRNIPVAHKRQSFTELQPGMEIQL
ncbi:MAG: glycosyl hydrolase family 65 protein, partial [Kiritimatiellia bacterium]